MVKKGEYGKDFMKIKFDTDHDLRIWYLPLLVFQIYWF